VTEVIVGLASMSDVPKFIEMWQKDCSLSFLVRCDCSVERSGWKCSLFVHRFACVTSVMSLGMSHQSSQACTQCILANQINKYIYIYISVFLLIKI
jgi:hypothetical protein